MRLVALMLGVSILWLSAGGPAAEPVRPAEEIAERTRARIHTRRIRVQPTWAAEAGACLDLDERDLEVVLRGERLGPQALELDRLPRRMLHALVIDTSSSMRGQLHYVRRAAREYIDTLRPHLDRAMLITFDDSVVLHQAATADREVLARAVGELRPGMYTKLHDGLYYTVQELASRRDRSVVVLLTDGVDRTSFHRAEDVIELIGRVPELTVFTIGFHLPEIGIGSPTGIRRYLAKLAARTNGKYFLVPSGYDLRRTYRRIREMADNEATLTVIDPDPEAAPGRLRVSSTRDGCRIEVLEDRATEPDSLREPIREPPASLPRKFAIPPDPRYLKDVVNRARHRADPECAGLASPRFGSRELDPEELWLAEIDLHGVRGCVLDVTMDAGNLYDPYSMSIPQDWLSFNSFMKIKSRWLDVPVQRIERLPQRPEELMEGLADFALEVQAAAVERDSRKRPHDEHARPYHDWPALVHGRTFFDLRARLAAALYLHPDYRSWVRARLDAEAQRDLRELEERFRRVIPKSAEEAVELAARHSEEGRRILARAEAPSARDLTHLLAAWLGDLSAHELFVRWEAAGLQSHLDDGGPWNEWTTRAERWRALRRLFFASSYTRLLTLLSPVRDRQGDRIGFYRVVLPRSAWYLPRVRNYPSHVGWLQLPNDLVPDLPLAHWVFGRIVAERPQVAAHLQGTGYRVESLDYRLLTKPGRQAPQAAYRETRVTLILRSSVRQADARLMIEADVSLRGKKKRQTGDAPLLHRLRVDVHGDSALEVLVRDAESTVNGPPAAPTRCSGRTDGRLADHGWSFSGVLGSGGARRCVSAPGPLPPAERTRR